MGDTAAPKDKASKTVGNRITSYFSPKQRAAAAASTNVDSDNSNLSQSNGNDAVEEQPEPKRRGRPKKVTVDVTHEKELENSTAEEDAEESVPSSGSNSLKRSAEHDPVGETGAPEESLTPVRKSARLAK